ncbi:hypothetical protein F2Q69_00000369 [Brassica cretica]|uniref:LisH domain-containing protein n=1 Tax=Brassica cretica TaxID=69181 RepID=A0A8S9P126_BRACR|nr:hypothetical protein F2Q69_00000369 [Brassica cretica]
MDPIATVKDGFNQVAKRQKHYHTISQAVTDGAFEGFVESLVQILTKNDPKTVLTELKLKLDSLLPINHLQESQKETNTSLTKFEKFLGKSDMFPASISIDLDHQLVDKMLVEYLYRQGLFEVGELLIKESEVDVDGQLSEVIARSLEIHRVTEPLKEKDTEPAMRWISENREKLKEDGSKLEMELVSLKYWEMLRQRKRSEALRFARVHFPKFASLHSVKIRKLIVALLWVRDLENYPHAEELFPLGWDKASRELTKQYYNLHDQPSSSLLAVALSAGVESLPRLLKLVRVMGLRKEECGEMKQQLPVDLELGDEFQFHSVFVCPVSREQSDEYNPPMMMPCRHVLCKETILRLCKCCSTRRFKCPYCHAYTTAATCRQSLEIHRVTEPLKEKDTEPAMRWISENREKLKEDGSKLEMELVSLKYWEMLRQRKRSEALRFARVHFPKFASLHSVKIRKLIVALLWVRDLENYPHAEELFPLGWDKASRELTKQYYNLHDQPSSSLLAVALSAGVESLPRLLKLVRVMGLRKEECGEMKQQLPVDLELGDEFQFHSVFVCPVSREQSDEYNPPMMMPCRHVLCKETILRLCKCCSTRRFKCPYCHAYTTAATCRQLYI